VTQEGKKVRGSVALSDEMSRGPAGCFEYNRCACEKCMAANIEYFCKLVNSSSRLIARANQQYCELECISV
jgi:hypothetical protein